MSAAAFRRARADEATALSKVARETFVEKFGHLYRRRDLDAFLDKSHAPEVYARLLADPDHALWVVEAPDGGLDGYLVTGPCDLPAPGRKDPSGELMRFYVRAARQGRGLGHAMLGAALDWLEARYQHIYLSVYSENDGAQRLYRRYGFDKICDYFYMVGEQADPEWIMERVRKVRPLPTGPGRTAG